MNDYIIGEKVILRPITEADTDLVVKWRNDPLVKKNFIYRGEFTRDGHLKWLREKVEPGIVLQCIIEIKEDSSPIGSVYFKNLDQVNKCAEYGIFIGEKSARGKGLGTETAKLFTRYGFEVLGLHRITLRLISTNDVAYKSYISAGFKYEGTARDMVLLDGKYEDIVFMSILEGEYNQ